MFGLTNRQLAGSNLEDHPSSFHESAGDDESPQRVKNIFTAWKNHQFVGDFWCFLMCLLFWRMNPQKLRIKSPIAGLVDP